MKKFILAALLVLALFAPVKAAEDTKRYCSVQAYMFPCELILLIYAPDGKTVFWAIRINPDGSQEVIYESEEAKPDTGFQETRQEN